MLHECKDSGSSREGIKLQSIWGLSVSETDPGETGDLEGKTPAAYRRGGGMSWCHVTRTEPAKTHCVTRTAWHSIEGAGGEESNENDQAEEENPWGFPE